MSSDKEEKKIEVVQVKSMDLSVYQFEKEMNGFLLTIGFENIVKIFCFAHPGEYRVIGQIFYKTFVLQCQFCGSGILKGSCVYCKMDKKQVEKAREEQEDG